MLEGKSEKLEFQKILSSPHRKIENQRKMNEKKEKERWMKGQWKMVPHKNDLWSDHPEIKFQPIYPFFRNHKPWPTLHTWKVHFDWTWILGLKRFFLEKCCNQQGCCLFSSAKKKILINHPPVWDEFLNFQVHNGTIKQKKWKGNEKMRL